MNLISCCFLLFTNMSLKFEHESDGVSTWAFGLGLGPIVMYCEVCCCLCIKYSI